jgi:hypothetical protein
MGGRCYSDRTSRDSRIRNGRSPSRRVQVDREVVDHAMRIIRFPLRMRLRQRAERVGRLRGLVREIPSIAELSAGCCYACWCAFTTGRPAYAVRKCGRPLRERSRVVRHRRRHRVPAGGGRGPNRAAQDLALSCARRRSAAFAAEGVPRGLALGIGLHRRPAKRASDSRS